MNLQSVKRRFGIIGNSEALERGLSTAIRVASTDLSVLIQGESGVGKEIFSRIIHDLSKRKHNNFIAINCGAIPAGTINSELFGHEKGAFTGATGERKGYFETVDKGTIFLDEIGEMPLDTQSYLLRILESGEYIKVGSSKVLKTNVRVIAATNVSLQEHIKKGKFREDLYYRLNTVPIFVPALHERKEDIYLLFRKFASDFSEKYRRDSLELDHQARAILEKYSWPGNIRELKNLVEQMSVLSDEQLIDAETLVGFMPNIVNRNLPSIPGSSTDQGFEEREILFKFLFEMKNDLNDLKSLVFELIKSNDLSVPNIEQLKKVNAASSNVMTRMNDYSDSDRGSYYGESPNFEDEGTSSPIIINHGDSHNYDHSEEVDESLSLESMEKDFIKKALKKYKGRRKDAADELGISERTLYRKIKQYEIEE